MIWYGIAFVVVAVIVMGITCIITFRSQFDRLEHKVEEEYQKLYPVLKKRRDILSSFFSANKMKQWGGDEVFNHSLLNALEELSGDAKDRNLILSKHALLSSLLMQGEGNEAKEQNRQEELKDAWQKLEGYEKMLAVEEDYFHAIEPLQLAIHTYNVLIQVFPASFVAKLLKKEKMQELR